MLANITNQRSLSLPLRLYSRLSSLSSSSISSSSFLFSHQYPLPRFYSSPSLSSAFLKVASFPKGTIKPLQKSTPLKGMVACFTGTFSASRDTLTSIVESRGGLVKNSITNEVTVLIASEKEFHECTVKVQHANEKNIPIVHEKYLHDCIREGKRLPVNTYIFGSEPFKGIVACFTGSFSVPRDDLVALVSSLAGSVKSTVTNEVNILFATPNEMKDTTTKVLDARKKKIPIVNERYLHDCIEKHKMLPIGSKYLLKRPKEPKKLVDAAKEKKKDIKVKETKPAKEKDLVFQWSWKLAKDSEYVIYDAKISKMIENDYKEWLKSGKKLHGDVGINKQSYIDFSKMLQRQYDNPRKVTEVKREELSEIQ